MKICVTNGVLSLLISLPRYHIFLGKFCLPYIIIYKITGQYKPIVANMYDFISNIVFLSFRHIQTAFQAQLLVEFLTSFLKISY